MAFTRKLDCTLLTAYITSGLQNLMLEICSTRDLYCFIICAGNFLSSSSSQNGDQSTSNVYHIFADMVAQSGPALAEQLLKAAEASELVRQSRH
jgi:hypothetical protein